MEVELSYFYMDLIIIIIIITINQVYLDSESSSVYGLMVTGMEVTDIIKIIMTIKI